MTTTITIQEDGSVVNVSFFVQSTYRKHVIERGPFDTKEEAARCAWYLETVHRHKNVTILEREG